MRVIYSSAACSVCSVKVSMKYEPPRGSTVLVTPLSLAMTCCVRRAIRAAFSVGKARASSSAFVRSEEHTSELQSRQYLVCRLLLEKKKKSNVGEIHNYLDQCMRVAL